MPDRITVGTMAEACKVKLLPGCRVTLDPHAVLTAERSPR